MTLTIEEQTKVEEARKQGYRVGNAWKERYKPDDTRYRFLTDPQSKKVNIAWHDGWKLGMKDKMAVGGAPQMHHVKSLEKLNFDELTAMITEAVQWHLTHVRTSELQLARRIELQLAKHQRRQKVLEIFQSAYEEAERQDRVPRRQPKFDVF